VEAEIFPFFETDSICTYVMPGYGWKFFAIYAYSTVESRDGKL